MTAPADTDTDTNADGPGIDPFVPWLPAPADPWSGGRPRLAVKDVVDVAGWPTGGGHPLLLAQAHPAERDATAVARLRAALGAAVVGKTHTDELAYSLGGTNAHYGAPANPAAPDRLTGGSSSGTASAVASGRADLGLGTDTAGSIRVPASFCGLFGFRPSHARAPRTGILPLAPSFDVPGLLTRDATLLAAAGRALLDPPTSPQPPTATTALLTPADLWSLVPGPTADALAAPLAALAALLSTGPDAAPLVPGSNAAAHWAAAREAFSTVQGAEAWAVHGPWVTRHRPAFGPGVTARLATAARLTAAQEASARVELADRLAPLRVALAHGAVLALPAAPGPAPRRGAGFPADPGRRAATLALTCLASGLGAPAVALPLASAEGAPLGLCLVAAPGRDEDLLDLAVRLAAASPATAAGTPRTGADARK